MSQQKTRSAEETVLLARSFAKGLRRGDVVGLYGELGTGKTQFVKGVCEEFGVGEHVASPTFVILNRYRGRDAGGRELFLYHFDFYRVKSVNEIYDLGYEEFFSGDGICLIEWADKLGSLLPQRRYDVTLSPGPQENERVIEITPVGVEDDATVRRSRVSA